MEAVHPRASSANGGDSSPQSSRPEEGDTQEQLASTVSYGGGVRVEWRTRWSSSGAEEGVLNKGVTEGEVREEENGSK